MNGTKYEVPHCGAFSTSHSHPSWANLMARSTKFWTSSAGIQAENETGIQRVHLDKHSFLCKHPATNGDTGHDEMAYL